MSCPLGRFWWPTMYEDTAKFVHQCEHCQLYKPMPKVTLYTVMGTPDWAEHVVKHLTTKEYPKDMPKHRLKLLDAQCKGYEMIGGQLYKRGYDGVLRLCVCRPKISLFFTTYMPM